MTDKKEKSRMLRMLNSICSGVLISSLVYMLVVGFEFYAMTVMLAAIVGAGAPVVASEDSILEMLTGLFEAIIEGVMAVVSGIVSVISGLFN